MQVRETLMMDDVVMGAFSLQLEPKQPWLWLIEHSANARSRHRQLPYGDQALFMRREVTLVVAIQQDATCFISST